MMVSLHLALRQPGSKTCFLFSLMLDFLKHPKAFCMHLECRFNVEIATEREQIILRDMSNNCKFVRHKDKKEDAD
jgi:hypothetical protein